MIELTDDDDRPRTDWEARVAKAKRDGTWYGPDEEPSPYPPRVKRMRFLAAFLATLAVGVSLGPLLHVIFGRPGPAISLDVLFDSLMQTVFPALFLGWTATRPPRKKS